METKRLILSQKIFLALITFSLLYYSFIYYKPWLEALFIEDISNESLKNTTPRFYSQVIIETLRFLLAFLVAYAAYLYYKFLSNIEGFNFFSLENSKYLTRAGYLLVYYSLSIYIFSLIGVKGHLFNFGYTVFVGVILLSFGKIFLEAFKQKQENELTI